MYNYLNFSVLEGKTLKKIIGDKGDDSLIFECEDGQRFQLYHQQDCCENVYLEDVVGDLNDLIGTPITFASEESNIDQAPLYAHEESYTWTFYKLATIKGYVDLRWYGSSNGYYSEGVDFVKLD